MSQHNSSGDQHDDEAEIEQPRLEDSRTSLMQFPQFDQLQPYDLLMMLPNCRSRAPDPTALLSSTLMQESGLEQDWPTASSIGLANSRDSGRLSERLNEAKLSLGGVSASANDDAASSSSSASESAAAIAEAPYGEPVAASDATDGFVASICDEIADEQQQQELSENPSRASSPRLRILASDDVPGEVPPTIARCENAAANASQSPQQPHADPPQLHDGPPQRMLGLLQVCCLALDVLSEGGLLCDDARRWLTPELLCDKLCDRLARPRPSAPPPASSTASSSYTSAASDSSLLSSAGLDAEAAEQATAAGGSGRDSPTTDRVRRWLKAAAATPPSRPPKGWPNYSV